MLSSEAVAGIPITMSSLVGLEKKNRCTIIQKLSYMHAKGQKIGPCLDQIPRGGPNCAPVTALSRLNKGLKKEPRKKVPRINDRIFSSIRKTRVSKKITFNFTLDLIDLIVQFDFLLHYPF